MSKFVKLHAKRMQAESIKQAKAVKGKPMEYKRIRYIKDALYWRNVSRFH